MQMKMLYYFQEGSLALKARIFSFSHQVTPKRMCGSHLK